MCFYNKAELLAEFRKRKEPITLWKRGKIDNKTGTLYTSFGGKKDNRVEWLPGTTVKPHEICKALKDLEQAKAGLYFNTKQQIRHTLTCVNGIKVNRIITAQVHPKNIIGVNYDGTVNCCTKATVIAAPEANLVKWQAAGLKIFIKQAKDEIRSKEEATKKWEEERDEHMECLEQMEKQLAELTA